jgi:BON domain
MEKYTMKLNFVVSLSVVILAASGYSQTTSPGTPTGPTSPGAAGTPPPTLNPGIGTNSLEAQRRTQPANPPEPGQIVVTNGVAANTNQFAATNLTPTSQPGFTNRIVATNAQGLLTNGSAIMRDQAISEPDRRLLGQIRTAVFGSSQPPPQLGGTSVHFILRDGVVRIVGVVPTVEEQKRIEGIVQQVPGVARVYDALQVGASATTPGQPQ